MEALKAEIAKKRKLLEEKKLLAGNKKYMRRSELLADDEKKSDSESNPNKAPVASGDDKPEDTLVNQDSAHTNMSRLEVIRRLRDFGEPIFLFAESELDAFKRLRKCEISKPEANRGYRNDFQAAMNEVDDAYLKEILTTKPEQSAVGDADKGTSQDR